MPVGVLLMHTLLAVMSLVLFTVLQAARSQSFDDPVSEDLQRLHMVDVLSMAALDTLHTLLALIAATALPGVAQALLVQGTVPATGLLLLLLSESRGEHQSEHDDSGGASGSSSATQARQPLRIRILHFVNHHSPAEMGRILLRSPLAYQACSGVAIAAMMLALVLGPSYDAAPPGESVDGATASDAVRASARLLFCLSTVVAACAAVLKQRCLSARPVDLVVLNTCTSALQLLMGLVAGPPLLLLLDGRPVRESLLQLARGLRCFMSGFNTHICAGEPNDAYGVPALLTFFISSSSWNAVAFGLLSFGGEVPVTIGSALVLPVTLLAFIRPVPLPYSWAAPPEPLSDADGRIALGLIVALALYHTAALAPALMRARATSGARVSPGLPMMRSNSVPMDDSGDQVGLMRMGPSLHL